jgi:hypothetical protein
MRSNHMLSNHRHKHDADIVKTSSRRLVSKSILGRTCVASQPQAPYHGCQGVVLRVSNTGKPTFSVGTECTESACKINHPRGIPFDHPRGIPFDHKYTQCNESEYAWDSIAHPTDEHRASIITPLLKLAQAAGVAFWCTTSATIRRRFGRVK